MRLLARQLCFNGRAGSHFCAEGTVCMAETKGIATLRERGPLFGVLSLVAGLVAAFGVTMVGLTSFLADFNPPDWVRLVSMIPIPFAVIASVGFGLAGFRGRGRALAIAGLVISAASTAAFIAMMSTGG